MYNSCSCFITGRDWSTWISCSTIPDGTRHSIDFLAGQSIASASYGFPDRHSNANFHYPTPSPSRRSGSNGSRSASPPRRSATPLSVEPLSIWNRPMYDSKLVTISTKFNPTLASNGKIKYRNYDKEERFRYTEIQRAKAENAEHADSVVDFTQKVFVLLCREFVVNNT